jgi:DNA-binding MarR family transcriptional regulator
MKTPAPRGDPIWFQVFNEIGIIQQLSLAAFERRLPERLSVAGFAVLNHLARLPGDWGPARLARAFQVTKGAMTNTIQRLEAEGYVTVEADPRDARAKFVRPTQAGRAVREASIASLAPVLSEMNATFGADAAADALPFLKSLRAWLDAHR